MNHADQGSWATQIAQLERGAQLTAQLTADVIDWLLDDVVTAAPGSVLDVGAGLGQAAFGWARRLPGAQVGAVDAEPALVAEIERRADQLGVANRVLASTGDLTTGISRSPAADLIWAAHVLHHLEDPVAAIAGLLGRLRRGGHLVVLEGGLPMRVLPGGHGVATPAFVSRLETALSEHYAGVWAMPITAGAADWPVLVARGGATPLVSRTFVLEHRAPLRAEIRSHVIAHYEHVRTMVGERLDPADRDALDRLLDPSTPAALVNRPDLFVLSATTVHVATNP